MMQALPSPTIDHVVINVRDRLDEAQALYRRLGFHLTPRGYHSLGSMNHLAIFGTDYLELIAMPPGSEASGTIMTQPPGLNAMVFGVEDSDRLHARLVKAGVPVNAPLDFVRPVELLEGPQEAGFRTVNLAPEAVPAGRLYFCQHLTRNLVWRDEWRHHANGVVGVVRHTMSSATPAVMGELLTRMFGAHAMRSIPGGVRLLMGLSDFDVVTPDELWRRYGTAAPAADGRADYMAALTLRTRGLDVAAAALKHGGIPAEISPEHVLVAAADTMGVTLEFVT